ncbi:MAG: Glycosyl transferase family 2 [Candidatus Woesebacteria bacterium GW2011_GWB1_41_10]|uniref:Glycosyl transferase family 2 n=1 Tax=Candidatus Woesebacteria bacterium GW2011_GWB1_41_10 TaxID=1618577 RepID=A0A0G0UH83_9BACT|nr:MAG: Glycosyl transferase family 2 [Candidatus Woesebacteria bacterium GW2011_GWB1_41_10]
MKKPLVSIIIVNWNGGEVFDDCLKTLKNLDYPAWELIVVDNASTDGSEKLPGKYRLPYKRYVLIKNKKNTGFAPANNQGRLKAKGEYILLLNNDTKVPMDFLTKMVDRMEEDKSIGAMQPKIKLMDKPEYLDNAGTFLTRTGFLKHWGFMERDRREFNRERIIFSAKGACLLTRDGVIKKAGGLFDDDFVSYFEDSDYCYRVWLTGYKVIYWPGTFIYHKLGYTSKRMSQIGINYNSLKNSIASYFKNLGAISLFTLWLSHIVLILGLGFYYLARLRWDKAKMVFDALKWNALNFGKNLRKRNKIQKLRIVSDGEIFRQVMHKVNIIELLSHFLKVEANFKQ